MALGKGSEQPVGVVPVKCSRLARKPQQRVRGRRNVAEPQLLERARMPSRKTPRVPGITASFSRRRWRPSAAMGRPPPLTRRALTAPSAPRPGLATRGAQPPALGSLDRKFHPLRFGRPSSSLSAPVFSTRHLSSCRGMSLT